MGYPDNPAVTALRVVNEHVPYPLISALVPDADPLHLDVVGLTGTIGTVWGREVRNVEQQRPDLRRHLVSRHRRCPLTRSEFTTLLLQRLGPGRVIISAQRLAGIELAHQRDPQLDLVLLDDAFQHRYVKPDFNILITDYSDLFYNDQLLPAGRLREPKSGVKRADVVIVSKSPESISASEMQVVRTNIQKIGIQQANL